MKEIAKKVGIIFIVLNVVGLGIALLVVSRLGADSISVMCDGIDNHLPVSFGVATMFYNVSIILLAFVLARKNLGIGTACYAVLIGAFIDLYLFFIDGIDIPNKTVAVRAVSFAFGQMFYSLGLATLIELRLGMNALDAILMKIHSKTGFPYKYMRISIDFLYVLVGALLGGVFGIGTVLSVIFTGLLVAFFGKHIRKILKLPNEEERIKETS